MSASGLGYCGGATARDTLIMNRGWTIRGDAQIALGITGRDTVLSCGTHTFNLSDLLEDSFVGSVHYGSTYGDYSDTITTDVTVTRDTTFYIRDSIGVTCVDTARVDITILPFSGTRIYVDSSATSVGDGSSWATAFKDLQDAIDVACVCDTTEIWIAEGTYFPSREIYTSFEDLIDEESLSSIIAMPLEEQPKSFYFDKDVQIYGGFSGGETLREERDYKMHKTILHGAPPGITEVIGSVVVTNHVTDAFIMDGVTIANGGLEQGYSGEMELEYNASGLVSGLIGGGWYNIDITLDAEQTGSGPTIRNCDFNNNISIWGGAFASSAAAEQYQPTFYNCSFKDNYAFQKGGAIYYSEAAAERSAHQPIKGAIYKIDSSRFYNNAAGMMGGAIASHAILEIHQSQFENNTAEVDGGAVYLKMQSTDADDLLLYSCL